MDREKKVTVFDRNQCPLLNNELLPQTCQLTYQDQLQISLLDEPVGGKTKSLTCKLTQQFLKEDSADYDILTVI